MAKKKINVSKVEQPKIITARHSVNLGDLIYSLWGLRAAARRYDAKIRLLQWIDKPVFYYEGATHPTRNERGVMVSMNKRMFDMVKPLIESLPFIHSFEIYDCQKVELDLDRCRNMNVNIPFGDIRRWIMYANPDIQADISEQVFDVIDVMKSFRARVSEERWAKVDGICSKIVGQIVVNRTERYLNPNIVYRVLQDRPERVYFVGTMAEYADFQSRVPKSIYLPVEDFQELALYIGVCGLFVGNQSFCFSIAEAIKSMRLLEVCSYAPNVIPTGPHGYDFYDQDSMDWLVNDILDMKSSWRAGK